MLSGQSPQRARGSAIFRVGRNFPLFAFDQSHQLVAAWAESELAIEPERARLNRLIVVFAELVRIHRDAARTHVRAQATQNLCVDPSGFAAAKGVKGVETDLDPFAQTDSLDVVDGHAIFERKPGDIGAQRQAAFGRKSPEVNHSATTYFDAHD